MMQRTRHCLLVGEGALRFARAHGFPEVNLLTDEARAIWLHWKETHDSKDDWLPPPVEKVAALFANTSTTRVTGTIHCSVLDTHGDLGCTTTTSGLSWKIPGRVGDSPDPGRGTCTWITRSVRPARPAWARLNLLNLSSYLIVEGMRRGLHPKDAIMEICKTNRHHDVFATPSGGDRTARLTCHVSFYAVSKDGKYAGGSIYPGAKMAVHDGESARLVTCDALFDK